MEFFSKRISESLPIDQMFKKVINDVRDVTGGFQVPAYNYNLLNDFYFNGKSQFQINPISKTTKQPELTVDHLNH